MKGPILVTGASGLLGREVKAKLEEEDTHEVIGLSHTRDGEGLSRLDLTDAEAVSAFLGVTRPATIVHCAAERRPDVCEGQAEQTHQLNVGSCETLAKYVEEQGARIVYISTDYVFDGSAPPYKTDAKTNPLNAYGLSKLAGEKVFLENIPHQSVILRVPILYGPVEYTEESQVSILAEQVKSEKPERVDDWATRYPTFTPDVAQAISSLLKLWETDASITGIQHFSGTEAITKYGMCLAIAKLLGYSTQGLSPDPDPPKGAPRPQNSRLDDHDLRSKIPSVGTSFEEGLRSVLQGI